MSKSKREKAKAKEQRHSKKETRPKAPSSQAQSINPRSRSSAAFPQKTQLETAKHYALAPRWQKLYDSVRDSFK